MVTDTVNVKCGTTHIILNRVVTDVGMSVNIPLAHVHVFLTPTGASTLGHALLKYAREVNDGGDA